MKPLIKALTEAGIGPRRRMAESIKQGQVAVNGRTAESFNHPVNTEEDAVSLSGRQVQLKPDEPIYLMLNKPEGLVSTVSDEKGRPTVLDILPPEHRKHRLYPVGRLDKDTAGLLLLTNDGDLTYRLTHPKFEYEKEYLVQMDGRLKAGEIRTLERGIRLDDGITQPARIKPVASAPLFQYSIVIHEGRKRQVRRIFESLGHYPLALKRVRMGGLKLGALKEGQTRRLRPEEIRDLLAGH
ncbi:MAG: pseudouridine synthase [Chloroflexi bacterium RBG_16_56_11]|nr:MAG: pseudouridine synthase [Chloroflexi bacterium RBG_16_56_11]